jgi:hypothetical protein
MKEDLAIDEEAWVPIPRVFNPLRESLRKLLCIGYNFFVALF